MIKYNTKTIIDWNFDDSNIVKVYHNGAVVFYKFDTEQGGYKVCYAVVEDITQYSETEFEDVYDKATEKWYKLNNLNQYEEYGIYGSGRNITTYDGKLTIDGTQEYEWNGSNWVNLGEVSGSSITIKSPEYIEKNSSHTGYCELLETFTEDTKIIMKHRQTVAAGASIIGDYFNNDNDDWRVFFASSTLYYDFITQRKSVRKTMPMSAAEEWEIGNYYIKNTATGSYYINGTQQTFSARPNQMYLYYLGNFGNVSDYGQVYYIKIYRGETLVRDFIPWTDMNGNYGLYDKVENQLVQTTGQMTASTVINDVTIGSEVYPKYYSEKSEPLDNLTFNTMEDAQAYAEANCVYDGMHALIAGDRYVFDSEEGWVVVPEYYKFEDVTPNSASGWTISGSATYNPDPTYYDDFDLETTSTSSSYKIAKVTIYGYDHFTYYLRSYHPYMTSYAYVMATNVDEVSTPPSTMLYNSSSAITNTYNWTKSPKSAVNLSKYRRVTYNNLDKTVEHTFYVYFYGRTYSSYVGNATILIPKEQTNENWEQVTFSASSNVASNSKNLYIDGNASTSGGTSYFYYRWMVGLPSGSHTSYTNYSNYNYCPNATSSTFTSVAGNSRQVNYTYDNTTNKNLSMRLVDTNGNVITPTNTIYYYIYRYNSCNVSDNASISLPSTQTLKVGGRFYFSNSSSRHYIYGYTAPATGTTYYVDNYSSTFDSVYTALTRESVSVTYTTYDPNDSETPAFKTDITWPYSGGTTSSTTLTSYTVPYTYPYEVSQTNDKFSAASQTYTAGQSSRAINFVLYPNNREFATVADMEAYAYAWEGMKASVNGTKYTYKNGQWVEQSYVQYEYIRTANLATSYYRINTGFYPTTANTFEVKVEFVDRSVDWGAIIEWRPGSSQNFEFDTVTSGYQAIIRTGGNGGVSYRPTIGVNNPTVYTLPLSAQSGTYSINGGSTQTIQYNYSVMQLPASIPMGIFGAASGTDLKAAVCKLYYLKVYDGNGNLVKHYVPSDNDGTPCFYEIVDGEYIMDTYTGSNHGTLTLGPAI